MAALLTFAMLFVGGSLAAPTAAPVNTSRPTITGEAIVGQTLVASAGSWSGTTPITFAFVWKRCDRSGGNCYGNATGRTWVVKNGDVGSTLRVQVTAKNSEGSASALSVATVLVRRASLSKPVNMSRPTTTGEAIVGQTLVASAGSWSGTTPITFAFVWKRCDRSGGNCYGNATGRTWVVKNGDVGSTLRVQVTAKNSEGSASALSVATAVVRSAGPSAPRNTVEPTITGTARVGQVETLNRGSWTGASPLSYAYAWLRCKNGGATDPSNCPRITNADNATYVAREADAGFRLRAQVTAKNSAGTTTAVTNPTQVILSDRPTNTAEPTISGTPVVGQQLTANRGAWAVTSPSHTPSAGCAAAPKAIIAARSQERRTFATESLRATSAARCACA